MRIILDHLYQDFVGPLVQDLCHRIPVSRPLWTTTCARSLYQAPVRPLVPGSYRTTYARSPYQDSFGPLVSSCRTTCAKSLFQDPIRPLLSGCCRTTCTRSLYHDLLDRSYQDPRLCRTTSARSLHQDPNLYQDHLGPLAIRVLSDHLCKQDLCIRLLFDDLCQHPFQAPGGPIL